MKDAALELAYAASDAYRYEAENLAVITGEYVKKGKPARRTKKGKLRPAIPDRSYPPLVIVAKDRPDRGGNERNVYWMRWRAQDTLEGVEIAGYGRPTPRPRLLPMEPDESTPRPDRRPVSRAPRTDGSRPGPVRRPRR